MEPIRLPDVGDRVWIVNARTPHFAVVTRRDERTFRVSGFACFWDAKGYDWAWAHKPPAGRSFSYKLTTEPEEITL